MGISLYSGFVGGRSIDKLFEHIEAVLDMGGESVIGFGSDIDGCESLVGNSDDSSVFNDICEEFFKRNYPAVIIEGILHKNLERVIENRKKSG
jgi:microsomal dipeptidase-like Zn-dependent dipeptidase